VARSLGPLEQRRYLPTPKGEQKQGYTQTELRLVPIELVHLGTEETGREEREPRRHGPGNQGDSTTWFERADEARKKVISTSDERGKRVIK